MSLKRYNTVICVGHGMADISLEERNEMAREAEKILKEDRIKFYRSGYEFRFGDTRGIEEAKLQKYIKKLFIKESIHFNFWHDSLKDAPQTDEELIEYLKDFLIRKRTLTITEVREEVNVGRNRAIKLMNKLVECGLSFPRKDKRGSRWRLKKK